MSSQQMEFLLIGNLPSILHGTYHTQTKPYYIPSQKNTRELLKGGQVETILASIYLGEYLHALILKNQSYFKLGLEHKYGRGHTHKIACI